MIKKYVSSIIALAGVLTLAGAVPVLAQTTATTQPNSHAAWAGKMGSGMRGNKPMMKPGVFGTVSAVNGNTITVAGKQGPSANTTTTTATTTFTVDVTNAIIMKNGATSTVANIAVGDTIMAQGTLTGTNLVATMIRDGKMMGNRGIAGDKGINSTITGNGQPIVAGKVSSINGSTLTITNKSNVTYTVDATNAKIINGPNTATISNVAVGDMVIVQGAVSGNAIVATSVIDQAQPVTASTSGTTPKPHQGFFAGIGSFFGNLFGF